MPRDSYQIFLDAKECSRRGVRYRKLTPSEKDAVLLAAGKLVGAVGSQLDLRVTATREGVKKMLVAVTTKGDLADENAVQAASWTDLDAAKLEMDGPFSYDALFTGKDDEILAVVYRRLHEASALEVDAIMGKALQVSGG